MRKSHEADRLDACATNEMTTLPSQFPVKSVSWFMVVVVRSGGMKLTAVQPCRRSFSERDWVTGGLTRDRCSLLQAPRLC